MRTVVALIGAGTLACTLAGPPPGARESASVPPPAPAAATVDIGADVLIASNDARAEAGRPRMTRDAELDRIATEFAHELAGRRVLDHYSVRAGRRTLSDRLAGGSRAPRIAGENLASIWGDATIVGARAIELWLGSDSHRTNLLGAEFTRSGVGVARGEDGFWYVVQLYAAFR